MTFISLEFIIFFIVTLFFYYNFKIQYRWIVLLVFSLIFYISFVFNNLLLLLLTVLIDYYFAKKITLLNGKNNRRKLFFILGISNNVILLLFFKYGTSIININNIIVPLGLSYFTFKKISYLIDVYREQIKASQNFGKFLLYILFFPSVIAGPIDRAKGILSQFDSSIKFDLTKFTLGLRMILWGVFKKIVIADNLAIFVNKVYSNPHNHSAENMFLATLFFSFQIYCDFSGYSDIAIGLGKTFGIDLMKNFDRPYSALSLADFWRRWHISLSFWLRDYIFLPISFSISRNYHNSRISFIVKDNWLYFFSIMSTMLLCGIWHGDKVTFVIWGAIHGLIMGISFSTKKIRKKIRKKLKLSKQNIVYKKMLNINNFFIVTIAWIFFRAESLSDSLYISKNFFKGLGMFLERLYISLLNYSNSLPLEFLTSKTIGVNNLRLLFTVIFLLLMVKINGMQKEEYYPVLILDRYSFIYKLFVYLGFVFAILIFGNFGEQEFLYAQF